jgi:hypothetical protein
MDDLKPHQARFGLTVWLASTVLLLLAVNGALIRLRPEPHTPPRVGVQTLKDLSELITVEYRVKKLVSARDIRWYGDRQILIETAAVLKAGIDLSRFDARNIEQHGDAVTITLPRAELMQFNMQPRNMHEIYNQSGLLRSDFSNEEKDVILRQGEADIRARVNDMGVLRRAEANARVLLESWVHRSGFRDIRIRFAGETGPGGGK